MAWVRITSDDGAATRHALALLTGYGYLAEADAPPGEAAVPCVHVALLAGSAAERLDGARSLLDQHPGVPMVLTLPDDAGSSLMRRALREGVRGIVLDGRLDGALAATVLAVATGQLTVPPAMRRQLAPRHLSFRERQVLSLVVLGYTNRQIADELVLAESTIKTHLSSAFAKLEAHSRAEAAAVMLDPEDTHHLALVPVRHDLTANAA